uniref:Peptidase S1 domain-containing protein n=1 Tax=Daphnia galeata TaxID=27404 RepID=A0A8J2RJ44_9CRUS|nr:unnamed protein product [Daphnia galeata]
MNFCSLKKCGIIRSTSIIGGTSAQTGDFPYMTSLYFPLNLADKPKYRVCSGTLISSSYILTAAHCVDGLPTDTGMGFAFINTLNTTGGGVGSIVRRVSSYIAHQQFFMNTTHISNLNDIALLVLDEPVTTVHNIPFVQLPTDPSNLENNNPYNINTQQPIKTLLLYKNNNLTALTSDLNTLTYTIYQPFVQYLPLQHKKATIKNVNPTTTLTTTEPVNNGFAPESIRLLTPNSYTKLNTTTAYYNTTTTTPTTPQPTTTTTTPEPTTTSTTPEPTTTTLLHPNQLPRLHLNQQQTSTTPQTNNNDYKHLTKSQQRPTTPER